MSMMGYHSVLDLFGGPRACVVIVEGFSGDIESCNVLSDLFTNEAK